MRALAARSNGRSHGCPLGWSVQWGVLWKKKNHTGRWKARRTVRRTMHEVTAGASGKVASRLELSAGALAANVATLRKLSADTNGPRALGAVL